MKHERIIIIDFGGQYAHLIASRIRRENVLAEIHQPDEIPSHILEAPEVKGIILSGGPQSVYEEGSPYIDPEIFDLGKPVLGICYGHQFMSHNHGGTVTPGDESGKEFGRAELTHSNTCPLFEKIPEKSVFWMSHGDEVSQLPDGFKVVGTTPLCNNAAIWNPEKNLFGIQFHPEVTHSEYGTVLLKNFLDICQVHGDWTIEHFLQEKGETLKKQIGDRNVFLFVSGGVDSTVCFAFLSHLLGADRVKGLFVDTGLLRSGERTFVEESLRNIGADLTTIDAKEKFLRNLSGKTDPEEKRSIIGNTFLEVQREFFAENKLGDDWVLAQGTIYPDTIESGGTKNSSTIKTHHNRVPEIQKMIDEGKVIEPVADLYKDEVRNLGELLKLPKELVWRHPFPGPGLGVRILCSDEQISGKNLEKTEKNGHHYTPLPIKSVGVQGDFRTYRHPAILHTEERNLETLEQIATDIINKDSEVNRILFPLASKSQEFLSGYVPKSDICESRIEMLQKADKVVTDTLLKTNTYTTVWQFPVVLIPLGFELGTESVVLRPIDSIDAMSATVGKLPWEVFETMAQEIQKIPGISAVFLDITSKPPGTIEWE